MNDLGDHLDAAAGAPEPPLDVAGLQARAAGRATTKRRALAGGAAAALLLVGALTFTAVQGGGSGQVVTASEGGDGTETTEAPATTEPVVETTVVASTETTLDGATTVPESVPDTVPGTLVTPTEPATPTTPPTTTTTAVPDSSDAWFRVGGTYVGHEVYRLSSDGCPKGMNLTHVLTSTFTVTSDYDGTAPDGPWTYKSDYCSMVSGDSWSGSGTFAITTPDGSQLLGTVTDDTAYPTDGEPYTVVITNGTGQLKGVTGTCELTVSITDKVFGSQTQSGDFKCEIRHGDGTTAAAGGTSSTASASAAFR